MQCLCTSRAGSLEVPMEKKRESALLYDEELVKAIAKRY